MVAIDKYRTKWLVKSLRKLVVLEIKEYRNNVDPIEYRGVLIVKSGFDAKVQDHLVSPSLEAIGDWINNQPATPVIVLVNTDRLLFKLIPTDLNASGPAFLDGLPEEDFLIQEYQINDKQRLISFGRKHYLTAILETLRSIDHPIIKFSTGFFPLFITYPWFSSASGDKYEVTFENIAFTAVGQEITSFQVHSDAQSRDSKGLISLENEEISAELLLAFSYGLWFLSDPKARAETSVPIVKQRFDEFVFRLESRIFLYGGLLVLFSLLAVSTILYSVYDDKYDALNRYHKTRKEHILAYEESQRQRIQEEEVLQRVGISGSTSVAFFADQLTASLSDEMYLTKLSIHPSLGISLRDTTRFDEGLINVEGHCYTSNDLNTWVRTIKAMPWVLDVIIKKYVQNDQNALGQFEINVYKKSKS